MVSEANLNTLTSLSIIPINMPPTCVCIYSIHKSTSFALYKKNRGSMAENETRVAALSYVFMSEYGSRPERNRDRFISDVDEYFCILK